MQEAEHFLFHLLFCNPLAFWTKDRVRVRVAPPRWEDFEWPFNPVPWPFCLLLQVVSYPTSDFLQLLAFRVSPGKGIWRLGFPNIILHKWEEKLLSWWKTWPSLFLACWWHLLPASIYLAARKQTAAFLAMQSTLNYLWKTDDVLGQGATASVYKARNKVRRLYIYITRVPCECGVHLAK